MSCNNIVSFCCPCVCLFISVCLCDCLRVSHIVADLASLVALLEDWGSATAMPDDSEDVAAAAGSTLSSSATPADPSVAKTHLEDVTSTAPLQQRPQHPPAKPAASTGLLFKGRLLWNTTWSLMDFVGSLVVTDSHLTVRNGGRLDGFGAEGVSSTYAHTPAIPLERLNRLRKPMKAVSAIQVPLTVGYYPCDSLLFS